MEKMITPDELTKLLKLSKNGLANMRAKGNGPPFQAAPGDELRMVAATHHVVIQLFATQPKRLWRGAQGALLALKGVCRG